MPAKNRDIDFTGEEYSGAAIPDHVLNQWEGMFGRDEKGESAAHCVKLLVDAVRHLKKSVKKLSIEADELDGEVVGLRAELDAANRALDVATQDDKTKEDEK